jgi:FMN phosphatase YigB (HAD superfamily)
VELLWVCLDLGGVLHDDRATRGAMVGVVAELVGVSYAEAAEARASRKSILETLEFYASDEGEFLRLREGFERRVQDVPAAFGPPPYDDVPGALERLSRRYSLALASNTPGTARPWLERYGLTGFFKHFYLSNEVGFRKPQAEFFRSMIGSTGAEPGAMLMVGDRTDTDLAPALDAGMGAALVRRYDRPLPGYEEIRAKLFAEVESLAELADRLGC